MRSLGAHEAKESMVAVPQFKTRMCSNKDEAPRCLGDHEFPLSSFDVDMCLHHTGTKNHEVLHNSSPENVHLSFDPVW
ncbi:hypothetical protein GmHk_08G022016 [Glycine max]|nr:hypothetical protein GmHk_08G022016 [Glycine max]